MFTQLIESGSHKKDMARRGRFFVGTLGIYGLLLLVAGVASVYAYNEHLGDQDLEVTLITLPVQAAQVERDQIVRTRPKYTPGGGSTGDVIRTEIIADTDSPLIPNKISTHAAPPPSPPGAKLGDRNIGDGVAIGPPGNTSGSPGPPASGIIVPAATEPDPLPPPRVKPTPAPVKPPEQVRLSSGVINSKIITKPAPAYPVLAKQARVQGQVTVEILIDEQGRVVSAQATNGHPLLRMAAQQSAYQARFSPTSLSGRPVKVSGVITYNFILN
ncbi:MAG TPA: TonB family protein [Pyrinomonadaceae bacterium]|nr:TonB family protein [Pyrinomonadaceae bacterium]